MNEQKKQKLLEQYDDAAFALLLDEYAEEEGARLMAEFEAAQAAGQVPEMPAELDEQCRRMIRRDRAKKRGIRAARSFRKVAVKAAVAVLVFIGLITTVVMSVEALRVPVLSFFIEHKEKFSVIDLTQDKNQPTTDPDAAVYPTGDSLMQFIPAGYESVYYYDVEGLISCGYQNPDGAAIIFDMSPGDSVYQFDTEDAFYEYVKIEDIEIILIEKDGYRAVWLNSDQSIIYSLIASDLSKNEFLNIVTEIINLQS